MANLIGARALVENPEAMLLHTEGLDAEMNGDFASVHESFTVAQAILATLPETMDTITQSARIVRDNGFTYVREAIHKSDTSLLRAASLCINDSIEATAPIVSGTIFAWPEAPSSVTNTAKRGRREVITEHGATVSLLGRLSTVKSVMLGIDTRTDEPSAVQARSIDQQGYALAHDLLRRGNNGYYRVSNAMMGARQERLNGRLPHAFVWLGRAASGVAWTAVRDPRNFKSTILTVGNRLRDIRSYKAAHDSVLVRP